METVEFKVLRHLHECEQRHPENPQDGGFSLMGVVGENKADRLIICSKLVAEGLIRAIASGSSLWRITHKGEKRYKYLLDNPSEANYISLSESIKEAFDTLNK